VRGGSLQARREARERFLAPLLQLAEESGGHLPEIADGDHPHASRGCPAQAWSVGEALRLQQLLATTKHQRGTGRKNALAAAL
jgi:glycogen debranching enzyme